MDYAEESSLGNSTHSQHLLKCQARSTSLSINEREAQQAFHSSQRDEEISVWDVEVAIRLSSLKRISRPTEDFWLQQPGSIAARHGRRISQGDQILEINGHNVRKESNQKDVAHMIQNLDGAIVLLLGEFHTLQLYTGVGKVESSAVFKDQDVDLVFIHRQHERETTGSKTQVSALLNNYNGMVCLSAKKVLLLGFANTIATMIATVMPDLSGVIKSPCHSPSSSIRRSRLSIPDDTSKFKRDGQKLVEEFKPSTSTEKPRVPSILVTSF
ncbi:multiple PDZ domain protein [Caerostris extrusa]|uniref:Multiple PDZ domain protein n=1 Tax=Caerostris extrusa TaxID=172846 RepID=A0AAV4VFP1_CAEEX|nr:multiple PDZ domain protein [Caerostris extrusa]